MFNIFSIISSSSKAIVYNSTAVFNKTAECNSNNSELSISDSFIDLGLIAILLVGISLLRNHPPIPFASPIGPPPYMAPPIAD